MGRLTLNMVLSFAQFEREVTGERIRDKIAADGKGKSTGGGLISRGHLYKILRNPIYVGRLGHNDLVHEGQKAAIVDQTTWECVQNRLAAHAQRETQASQHNSDALMAGGCSTIAGI